ncbi:hypothetical protein Pse7429DRAFT_2260 [Pseudanabaena biceps PCC 7429]|uniref:Uncharacterized protein n=1 Tax=Pseudanabaena biceps PCC 7429 TaxID=927668 RepID=L8N0G0_9CYAN|nr:hypothetical protein Pse7429DRAFT_2260 [Pseudanabaena biceps PCC 7429]
MLSIIAEFYHLQIMNQELLLSAQNSYILLVLKI